MTSRTILFPALLASSLLTAQSWPEAGDAGSQMASAQVVAGSGPLTTITGNSQYDQDLFVIQIDNPATFSATCTGLVDSVLFLFDEQGRGVLGNDDWNGGLDASIQAGPLTVPGRYVLGVCAFGFAPSTPAGWIWNWVDGLPNGGGRLERLSSWTGATGYTGNYTIALTGASMVQKQVVLPDTHHLSENPLQLTSAGSTAYFTGLSSRFQLLYEASHFQSAGITGPVTLTRLLFRSEDGEPNPSIGLWNGAVVRIARTPVTAAAMSTTFANNLAAPAVVVGPVTTTVRIYPALGSTPNNNNVVIDLAAAGLNLAYDPNGALPNLLVDVMLPTSPGVPLPLAPMQDTTGATSAVRGAGLVGGAVAATGTLANPLVMAVEFTGGAGGRQLIVPARNESYGAACGGAPSSFYQTFVNGQAFDLAGLVMTPDNSLWPNYFTVARSSNPYDPSKVGAAPLSTSDEGLVTAALGFTLNYPGGQTGLIRVSTNGFVWLDGATTTQDFTPTAPELLGVVGSNPARLAPFWYDLHCGRNVVTHPNSGLHVMTDVSGGAGQRVCYITWKNVGVYNSVDAGGAVVCSIQCVIHESNGAIEFLYSGMPKFCSSTSNAADTLACVVGFSRGRMGITPAVDPVSRDLSVELPFSTAVEGSHGNLGLVSVATPVVGGQAQGGRLFPGQSVKWNVRNVPPSAILGVQLIDIASTRSGLQLPTITAPGCMLSTTANAVLWEIDVLPSANVVGGNAFSVPAGFDGFELTSQYVVLGGLFGAADLITQASNALLHTVGRQ